MKSKTRGEVEDEFSKAIVKFEKEYLGRGPLEARTFLIDDMVLIRLRGVITPAERKLAESHEGLLLVKETRRQLFESSRPLIEEITKQIVGCKIISLHTDMSAKTDERVIVLTVDTNLDKYFR